MFVHRRFAHAAAVLVVLSLACSGGGSGSRTEPTSPAGRTTTTVPVTLAGLAIAPSAAGGLSVSLGTSVQFTATGTYSDGSSADVTGEVAWGSSDPSAADFSSAAGGAGVLDPMAVGTTVISATHPDGFAASVAVTVLPLPLYDDPTDPVDSPLAISPENPTILIDTTMQFAVSATLEDLSVVDYTENVSWSSSDETVATISPTGAAAALGLGTTTITATDPVTGYSDTTTFTVTDVPAALGYLLLSRGSVIGGSEPNPVKATIVLTSYATQPVTISVWTSLWKKNQVTDGPIPEADVPASVVVAAGSDRATFDVTHHAVTRRTRVAVNAKDENQAIIKSASLWLRAQR
jgi:trimeric autotransporter adhesin